MSGAEVETTLTENRFSKEIIEEIGTISAIESLYHTMPGGQIATYITSIFTSKIIENPDQASTEIAKVKNLSEKLGLIQGKMLSESGEDTQKINNIINGLGNFLAGYKLGKAI